MPLVLLHLAKDLAVAEVVARGEQDRLDLRLPIVYADGHSDVLEIFGARRGVSDGQWEELPGEVLPALLLPVDEPYVELTIESEPEPVEPARVPTLLAR